VSTCVGGWGAGRRPSCLIEEYSATVLSTWIKHSAPLLHSTRMQRVTATPHGLAARAPQLQAWLETSVTPSHAASQEDSGREPRAVQCAHARLPPR
jgi:hypothetical protein